MLPNIDKPLGFKTYLLSSTSTGLELTYPRCSETYYRNHLIGRFSWDSWTTQTVSRHSSTIFSLLFHCPHPPLHFLHASLSSHVVAHEPVHVPALPVTQRQLN